MGGTEGVGGEAEAGGQVSRVWGHFLFSVSRPSSIKNTIAQGGDRTRRKEGRDVKEQRQSASEKEDVLARLARRRVMWLRWI